MYTYRSASLLDFMTLSLTICVYVCVCTATLRLIKNQTRDIQMSLIRYMLARVRECYRKQLRNDASIARTIDLIARNCLAKSDLRYMIEWKQAWTMTDLIKIIRIVVEAHEDAYLHLKFISTKFLSACMSLCKCQAVKNIFVIIYFFFSQWRFLVR